MMATLSSTATDRGGYVSASSANGDGVVARGQIVMKLPPPQLDGAMIDVRKLSKKIASENATSQDLTEEYYDVDAQMKALKAQEAQYLEFLKKAVNIDETLRVQAAITGVRVEINKLEGRSRFIERSSAMSTLSVDMQTAAPIVEEKRVNDKVSQDAPDALAAAKETLHDMTRFLAQFGLGVLRLAIWLPVWGPVVAVCYLFWRRANRRSSRPATSESATSVRKGESPPSPVAATSVATNPFVASDEEDMATTGRGESGTPA
jgi:hypothetical protein